MAVSTQPPPYTTASLYVGDLHPDVTEAILYEIYKSVGQVASIRVCRDSVSRQSLGYAYVNFQHAADAERALDTLNFTPVKGVPMRIMWSRRDPALRKSGAGNIFVKNLDKVIDAKALYDTFSLFGDILSCKVSTDAEGRSRGFGFVHYESEDSAKAAIDRVNKMLIGSKTVYVGPFLRKKDRQPDNTHFTNVYVKNFPASWNDTQLKKIFTPYGQITSQLINVDTKGRPFAFVNFESMEGAKKAVKYLHLREIDASGNIVPGDAGLPSIDEKISKNGEGENEKVRLYVQRAQNKIERQQMLRKKFHAPTIGGVDMHAGRQSNNLYVKNLQDDVDEQKLREMFSEFGIITSAKVMTNDKGVSRCFGFVCFSNADEAHKALKSMRLKQYNNKPLYVTFAEKRQFRDQRLQAQYSQNPPAPKSLPGLGMGTPMYPSPAIKMMFNQPQRPQPNNMMYQGNWNQMSRPPRPYSGNLTNQFSGPLDNQIGARPVPPPFGPPSRLGPQQPQRNFRGPLSQNGKMPISLLGKAPQGANYKFTSQARNQIDNLDNLGIGADSQMAAFQSLPALQQKQLLGEKLFPKIQMIQAELAGKITGMMLEMDNSELLSMLESDTRLHAKVEEAVRVLEGHKTQ